MTDKLGKWKKPLVMVAVLTLCLFFLYKLNGGETASDSIWLTVGVVTGWVFGILVIAAVVALIIISLIKIYRRRRDQEDTEAAGGNGAKPAKKPPYLDAWSIILIAVYLTLVCLAIPFLLPAFWGWWWGQQALFWVSVIGLPLVVGFISVERKKNKDKKAKFGTWLAVLWVFLVLVAVNWESIPDLRHWRLKDYAAAEAKAAAARAAVAKVERKIVDGPKVRKVITVTEDRWSDFVSIPFGIPLSGFRGKTEWEYSIDPQRCMLIKNGYKDKEPITICEGDFWDIGDHPNSREATLSFRLVKPGKAKVVIKW